MKTNNNENIERIAYNFWDQLKDWKGNPPYDIMGAISLLLPIDVISLSSLTLCKINKWLSQRKVNLSIDANDRPLHGFIVIFRGSGLIFINGTDKEDERRYTIAHEISHFMLDYIIPREKAVVKMGPHITDVLDGLREATILEKVDSIINNVAVAPYTHLLEIEGDGSFQNIKVFNSENRADALAIELLAPKSEVIKRVFLTTKKKLNYDQFKEVAFEFLINEYGLPMQIAKNYSKKLSYQVTKGKSFMNKLGF